MNQQPTKRRNPFEKPISNLIKEEDEKNLDTSAPETNSKEENIVEEPVIEEVVVQQQQNPQPQQVYQPQYQPQYAPQQNYYQSQPQQRASRTVKRETKNYYAAQAVDTREKFTSTMEQTLRRQIKIVCAQRGIMFAQFVEDACREKLEREGFK